MSISETYNASILEDVLRIFLQNGTIPTADQLLESYNEYTKNHPDMSKPFVLDTDFRVAENSNSSSSGYNAFWEQIKLDLEAAYQEVWDRMADGMESFDRWRLKLEQLKRQLLDLEKRIDGLLLLRLDTAGYFNFIEDNFVDFSKIDQENTSAKVDITNHIVTLNDSLEDAGKVNLNSIPVGEATFAIITREYILSSQLAPGTSVSHAVQDIEKSWQHRVKSAYSDKNITGEFKVRLGDSPVGVSRIEIVLHASNTNTPMIVTAMYSNDNYNWYNMPTDSYVQRIEDKAVFLFPVTQMQWVKLIMTKTGADDSDGDQYIYEFGAQSIKFFSTAGYDTEGCMLVSKELSAYDAEGNPINFNKIALQTCQQVPENTAIQYWITAKNDTDETNELRIDPYNVDNPIAPTIIELGRLLKTTLSDLVVVDKQEDDSVDFFATYVDLLQSDKLALIGTASDTALKITTTPTSRMVNSQIVFYRNIGENGGTELEEDRLVRDCPRGWKYTDETKTYISTSIIVNNSDGLWVDLGDETAVLDGQVFGPGTQLIPYGSHIFTTATRNTAALEPNEGEENNFGPFDTVDELNAALAKTSLGMRKINHKLLIEGVNYGDDFPEESKIYLGVDVYCEEIAKQVSIFDLMNNISTEDSYKYFAVDTDANGETVFVVKFDPDDTNWDNEYHQITYGTENSMFNKIVFKAKLISTSSDGDITPNLSAWRVKLGN